MNDVERIYDELAALLILAQTSGGPSDVIATQSIAAKALLLSAASYFERQICATILEVALASGSNKVIVTFIDKQALVAE